MKVGEIIECFNCQGFQGLLVKYSKHGQYLITFFSRIAIQKTVLSISENNWLLLLLQVYVTQILQCQQLQKSRGPNNYYVYKRPFPENVLIVSNLFLTAFTKLSFAM